MQAVRGEPDSLAFAGARAHLYSPGAHATEALKGLGQAWPGGQGVQPVCAAAEVWPLGHTSGKWAAEGQ